jgi:hypothetical protein
MDKTQRKIDGMLLCASKPRLVEITDPAELESLHDRRSDISTPYLFSGRAGGPVRFWANADELRAWREKRASTHQSGEN